MTSPSTVLPAFIQLTEKLHAFAAVAPFGGGQADKTVDELPERKVLLAVADVSRVEPGTDSLPLTTVYYRGGKDGAHYNVAESYEDIIAMIAAATAAKQS